MAVAVGDTVKVLAHRNGYNKDISTWRTFPFAIGETFVVGTVQDDDHLYPRPIVFPVGETFDFWREDDLEVVTRAATDGFVERVRHYRETLEIGLQDAKRMVKREDLLADIAVCNSFTAVRAILRQMAIQP